MLLLRCCGTPGSSSQADARSSLRAAACACGFTAPVCSSATQLSCVWFERRGMLRRVSIFDDADDAAAVAVVNEEENEPKQRRGHSWSRRRGRSSRTRCPSRERNVSKSSQKVDTHRFSHMCTPALFCLMYAGRFCQSSCSAGSLTCVCWQRGKSNSN